MIHRCGKGLYGVAVLIFLGLAGCPPPATTKPEATPAPPAPAARAPAAEERVARTAKPPPKAPPTRTVEAIRAGKPAAEGPLKEIYFDFDKSDIRADARPVLQANADWLRRNAGVRVEIEGHCDERGTNEYNLALGARRAQAAKDYLVTLGVAAGRISTISYGEEALVCREKTEECWQRNRRARFVVVSPKPAS